MMLGLIALITANVVAIAPSLLARRTEPAASVAGRDSGYMVGFATVASG